MPAALGSPGGWAGIHCWPSCHPSSSSSPLCLVDTDASQLFQASSHSPSLAQHQSFPGKSRSTKGFSTEWQCWLVGHGAPGPLYNQSGFSAGIQMLSELSYWVAHANPLSLMPHELGYFIGTCCFYRSPGATRDLAPPGTGSAAPPPPHAEKIHTSTTSSSGRDRVHLPAHILTDTTNRYLCLGDSVQNCCPGLEPSPRLLPTWQPLPGHNCAHCPALLLPPCTATPGARLSRCCSAPPLHPPHPR